jgi:hypothetical protein
MSLIGNGELGGVIDFVKQSEEEEGMAEARANGNGYTGDPQEMETRCRSNKVTICNEGIPFFIQNNRLPPLLHRIL